MEFYPFTRGAWSEIIIYLTSILAILAQQVSCLQAADGAIQKEVEREPEFFRHDKMPTIHGGDLGLRGENLVEGKRIFRQQTGLADRKKGDLT